MARRTSTRAAWCKFVFHDGREFCVCYVGSFHAAEIAMPDAKAIAQSVIVGDGGVQLYCACEKVVKLRVAQAIAVGNEPLGIESRTQVEKCEPST